MKNTDQKIINGQWEKWLDVCVDVSKGSLTWYHEGWARKGSTGELTYSNEEVINWLSALQAEAKTVHGYAGLRVVCESTAGYHRRLLRLARASGCRTALVSGEQVNALQVVESNDTGKSDQKDPRTMMLLVHLGKTLTDRGLSGEWAALRELDANYTRLENQLTRLKNRVQSYLVQLFPDLSFKRDWLFSGRAVQAVLADYGLDPHAIVAAGADAFAAKMKVAGLLTKTIGRLWRDAQEAVRMPSAERWREVLVAQLRDAYEDLARLQSRRERLRNEMTALLGELQADGQVKVTAQPGLISSFLLARIIAQTGPLKDFKHIRQLWRYAGMNLRPKQSGQQRGPERQAKRGRAPLRLVLGQAVLKLVVRGALYGEYYHAKKAAGMPGQVAMTAVSRKFLKLLFGMERSEQTYDPSRVFTCQSAYQVAAA